MLSYSAARMNETWGNQLQPSTFENMHEGLLQPVEPVALQSGVSENPLMGQGDVTAGNPLLRRFETPKLTILPSKHWLKKRKF